MDAVVLDTDVVSFGARQDSRFALYEPHLQGRVAVISFMTVAELEFWALARNWSPERMASLRTWIEATFHVVLCDQELCGYWARMTDSARRSGRVLHCATHGLPQRRWLDTSLSLPIMAVTSTISTACR